MSLASEDLGQAVGNEHTAREELELDTRFIAPRFSAEMQMADIWQGAFGIDRIGIRDDFFDLGGDSVHATIITAAVEHGFGVTFGLAAFAAYPTIEELTRFVSGGGKSDLPKALVPIRIGGSKPPLFLVHGKIGQTFLPRFFSEALDPDRPVFGFRARGFELGEPPFETVKELAQYYLDAMRSVQPTGPYFLGSFCAGALVALELAARLKRVGEAVGPLALIIPPEMPPGRRQYYRERGRLIREGLSSRDASDKARANIAKRWGQDRNSVRRWISRVLSRDASNKQEDELYANARAKWENRVSTETADFFNLDVPELIDAASRTTQAFIASLHDFEAPYHDGRIEIISSEDRYDDTAGPEYFWAQIAREVKVTCIGELHTSIFREPELGRQAAKKVNAILADVD
jgi:thioesterase domain-containing protein/acyl carrier protein